MVSERRSFSWVFGVRMLQETKDEQQKYREEMKVKEAGASKRAKTYAVM